MSVAMASSLDLRKTPIIVKSESSPKFPNPISIEPEDPNSTLSPHDNDVLCGRGGSINGHIGNERYRNLVNSKKRVYLAASFKREKRLIAASIVESVRKLRPPGRFLSRNSRTGVWIDIGDVKSRDKTSQALREGAPEIRKEMENDRLKVTAELKPESEEIFVGEGDDDNFKTMDLTPNPIDSFETFSPTVVRHEEKHTPSLQQERYENGHHNESEQSNPYVHHPAAALRSSMKKGNPRPSGDSHMQSPYSSNADAVSPISSNWIRQPSSSGSCSDQVESRHSSRTTSVDHDQRRHVEYHGNRDTMTHNESKNGMHWDRNGGEMSPSLVAENPYPHNYRNGNFQHSTSAPCDLNQFYHSTGCAPSHNTNYPQPLPSPISCSKKHSTQDAPAPYNHQSYPQANNLNNRKRRSQSFEKNDDRYNRFFGPNQNAKWDAEMMRLPEQSAQNPSMQNTSMDVEMEVILNENNRQGHPHHNMKVPNDVTDNLSNAQHHHSSQITYKNPQYETAIVPTSNTLTESRPKMNDWSDRMGCATLMESPKSFFSGNKTFGQLGDQLAHSAFNMCGVEICSFGAKVIEDDPMKSKQIAAPTTPAIHDRILNMTSWSDKIPNLNSWGSKNSLMSGQSLMSAFGPEMGFSKSDMAFSKSDMAFSKSDVEKAGKPLFSTFGSDIGLSKSEDRTDIEPLSILASAGIDASKLPHNQDTSHSMAHDFVMSWDGGGAHRNRTKC